MEPSQGVIRCVNCGAMIRDSARFCVECGTPVAKAKEAKEPKVSRATQKLGRPSSTMAMPAESKRSTHVPSATSIGVAPPTDAVPRTPAQPEGAPSFSRKKLNVDLHQPSSDGPPTHATTPGFTEVDEAPASMREALAGAGAGGAEKRRHTEPPISDILGDIDSTFDAILSDPGVVNQESSPTDIHQAQSLFKQIAVAYIMPVRHFMIELRMGEASKDWISVCSPALGSMAASAERMGLTELTRALEDLKTTLEASESSPGATVAGAAREAVLQKSERLVAELPEAFSVDADTDRRDPIIVRSLLAQVPGVRKVQMDKIYRAGITSLSMFLVAKPQDIAETTGLDLELCSRVLDRFLRYKKETLSGPADAEQARDLARLQQLAKDLERLNEEYEDDKKRVRRERSEVIHEINVVLARVGNVTLVEELERLPFARKVEELSSFLAKKKSA
jgi:hypothetical protein